MSASDRADNIEIVPPRQVVLTTVSHNGLLLRNYLSYQDDASIVFAAVAENGLALEYASNRLKNNTNVVIRAVQDNGYALEFATDRLKDDENVVRIAYDQNHNALAFASRRVRDIIDPAFEPQEEPEETPPRLIRPPIQNQQREVVRQNVLNDGRLLRLYPAYLDDFDIVMAAVRNSGLALGFASNRLRDNDLIVFAAVDQNALSLEYASLRLRDDEDLVRRAYEQDPYSLRLASRRLRELIEPGSVSRQSTGMTNEMREREKQVALRLVTDDGLQLRRFRNHQDDEEIVLAAVNNNGMALAYASIRLKNDEEVVTMAVETNGLALQFADERMQNKGDIVEIAMRQNPLAFEFAADRFKDSRVIVRLAINLNPANFRFVSDRLKNNVSFVRSLRLNNEILNRFASDRVLRLIHRSLPLPPETPEQLADREAKAKARMKQLQDEQKSIIIPEDTEEEEETKTKEMKVADGKECDCDNPEDFAGDKFSKLEEYDIIGIIVGDPEEEFTIECYNRIGLKEMFDETDEKNGKQIHRNSAYGVNNQTGEQVKVFRLPYNGIWITETSYERLFTANYFMLADFYTNKENAKQTIGRLMVLEKEAFHEIIPDHDYFIVEVIVPSRKKNIKYSIDCYNRVYLADMLRKPQFIRGNGDPVYRLSTTEDPDGIWIDKESKKQMFKEKYFMLTDIKQSTVGYDDTKKTAKLTNLTKEQFNQLKQENKMIKQTVVMTEGKYKRKTKHPPTKYNPFQFW